MFGELRESLLELKQEQMQLAAQWLMSCCRMNEEYRESLLRQEQKRLADLAAFQAKTTAAFQRAGGEAPDPEPGAAAGSR